MRRKEEAAVDSLEQQIDAWRAHLRRSPTITGSDPRCWKITSASRSIPLSPAGYPKTKPFLVAVKRMGAFDALTREFARGHSERLGKQLVLSGDGWDTAVENRASVLT